MVFVKILKNCFTGYISSILEENIHLLFVILYYFSKQNNIVYLKFHQAFVTLPGIESFQWPFQESFYSTFTLDLINIQDAELCSANGVASNLNCIRNCNYCLNKLESGNVAGDYQKA